MFLLTSVRKPHLEPGVDELPDGNNLKRVKSNETFVKRHYLDLVYVSTIFGIPS